MKKVGEEIVRYELIEKYRPRIAKHLGLKEEDVFPKICPKHKEKMHKEENEWYCSKCRENVAL